jgi:hypothetical protein
VAFSAEENQPVARMRLGVLVCRAAPLPTDEVFEATDDGVPVRVGAGCHYGPVQASTIFIDLGWSDPETNCAGALPPNGTTRLADVKDGASQTILLAEHGGRGAAWVSPVTSAGAREVFFGGVPGGAPHEAGLPVVFCDGTVRALRWDMDPRVFAALCTRAGGEAVSAAAMDAPRGARPKHKAAPPADGD